MQKINIDIFMGQSADIAVGNKLPCGITSYNPYIIWKIPNEIKQLRFAIKITNILDNSLLATFKSVTSISSYQIPLGNGLNNRWTGLCFIQVLISDNLESDVFQYTSGDVTQNPNGYFVIDSNIQTVSYEKPINYTWQKSIDENTEQTLLYHLQVANHPNFNNNSLIIDQQGIQSQSLTMITYEGFQLPIGNYFFKVRTFDGYDFSQWSTVNCFRVRQFQPPILKNLTYTITDNQTGDIIVEFDIQNKISDYTAVVLTYAYANNLQIQYPCILQETTHRVPNGHNSLTWQTVKNSKYSDAQLKLMGIQKINILQDVDLFLYAFPYYNGQYGDTVYTLISLKNQKYDVNTSSVGSVNENYIIRAKFSSPISHHKYYGWDSQYYQQILNNEIYTDKNYTDNYIYYKQLLSLPKKKENVVYNTLTTYLGELPVYINYIGWNSERYKYIVQNKQILISEKNTFDSKYYTEYLIRVNASDKYCQENYKGFKIKNNRYFHTLYVDGRTYRNNDKHSYTIKQPVSGQHDAFDFSAALGMGGDDDSRKVVTIPSYSKDTSFAPQFPGEAKLPFQSGVDRNGKDFKFKAETINWRNVGIDGDWKVKGYDKAGNIYYVDFWSAPLSAKAQSGNVDTGQKGKSSDKDQNLDKIISGEINYQSFFNSTSDYGAATYPDGKVIFQDEQKSPQYTMYPDYYTKEGYPVGISEKYWDNIKTQDMYIRKYKIVKGGSQTYPPYGHKDFKTQPSKGIYHCYFTNKSIPQLLIKSKNLLISTDGRVYYKKQNVQTDDFYPSNTQQKYIKINDLYKDLPYILYMQGDFLKYGQVLDAKCKICQQSGKITCNYCNGQGVINGWQTCLKCNGEKKITCPQCNGVQGSKSDRQSLYFLTYNRVSVGKRGQPQKYVFDEEKGEYKKPQAIFANIAVPQYIKSNKGVYSANGFNGKQSAFALGLQLKRDSRRYVLGRHYKWENKLKNINSSVT